VLETAHYGMNTVALMMKRTANAAASPTAHHREPRAPLQFSSLGLSQEKEVVPFDGECGDYLRLFPQIGRLLSTSDDRDRQPRT